MHIAQSKGCDFHCFAASVAHAVPRLVWPLSVGIDQRTLLTSLASRSLVPSLQFMGLLLYSLPFAHVHSGSKRDTPGKSGACDGSDSMRRTIKSPARSHNGRNSGRARTNHAGDQNGVAQPSTGTKGTSSRQRPVSAPSKVYPFARHQELPSKEDGEEVEDSGRPTVGARARTHESRRPYADPATGGREAVKKRRDDTGNERCGRVRESESSAGRQRLSMSSIFGVASERRTSDERQTATKHPLLLDERGKVARRGVMGSGLQEGSNEEGETPNAPLSSQEFGLHRWKEYAVLR